MERVSAPLFGAVWLSALQGTLAKFNTARSCLTSRGVWMQVWSCECALHFGASVSGAAVPKGQRGDVGEGGSACTWRRAGRHGREVACASPTPIQLRVPIISPGEPCFYYPAFELLPVLNLLLQEKKPSRARNIKNWNLYMWTQIFRDVGNRSWPSWDSFSFGGQCLFTYL